MVEKSLWGMPYGDRRWQMISKIDDGRSLTCDDIASLLPDVDECPACISVDGPCQFTFSEQAGIKDTD